MTKAPDTSLRECRVVVMMSKGELKAVDDWRFEHRIASRGEAMRRLMQMAIRAAIAPAEVNGELQP